MEPCQQNIWRTAWARIIIFGSQIVLINFEQNSINIWLNYLPFLTLAFCIVKQSVVSFTQTSRGTSDENRLRQRGSGDKRQVFLLRFWLVSHVFGVTQTCDTNHSSVSAWSCDLARSKSFGRHIGKIKYFQFLWGLFLSNYIDSNIHFYINCMFFLNFECFNSQELLEMRIYSKIIRLSYERGR